jgi:hypothetical protein
MLEGHKPHLGFNQAPDDCAHTTPAHYDSCMTDARLGIDKTTLSPTKLCPKQRVCGNSNQVCFVLQQHPQCLSRISHSAPQSSVELLPGDTHTHLLLPLLLLLLLTAVCSRCCIWAISICCCCCCCL